MNQDGVRQTPVSLGFNPGWNIIDTGDFNEDGTTDILRQKQSNGVTHAWLLNNNGQYFRSIDFGRVSEDWKLRETGDFNGDGTSDILWQHDDGQVHTWLLKDGQPGTDCDRNHGGSYYPELSSLSDDDWDRQSGDNVLFDGNQSNGESRSEIKEIFKDLSIAIFEAEYGMTAGAAHDQSYHDGVVWNGETGWWHAGIDIGANYQAPMKAAIGGKIAWIDGSEDGYVFVAINADDGNQWVYGHLKTQGNLQPGQRINGGDFIGNVGWFSGAPHLHLEVRTPPFQGTGGLSKDQKFLKDATMSPLQAYWELQNANSDRETCDNESGGNLDINISAILNVVPANKKTADTQGHVSKIVNEANNAGLSEAQIAYILGTVEHESRLGFWMEELADGSAYEGRTDLGNIYPGDGVRFKGRGYVQITGRSNYQYWSNRLGQDLVRNPELAENPDIAAKILVYGMRDGTFTGVGLSKYINDSQIDFSNARRIVNGTDRASLIAGYANRYYDALT